MTDRVRWAVIGYGRFGAIHAEVLSQADDCDLVAVCTRNEQRLAEARSRYPGLKATADYRQILADPQIDAVSITTHVADHHRTALDALAAGKHVLLEKPMAENTQQCREILEAARSAAGRFMVGHVCRFDPRVTLAREVIREGQIGRVFAMRSKRNLPVAPGPLRLDKISALLGDGVHDADLMMWFMNEAPQRVYGRTVRVDNFRYPDAGWAMLEFGEVQQPADQPAALGVVETNWRLPANTPTTIDAVLEVVGTEGQITIDCGHTGLHIICDQGMRMPDTHYWPQQHGRRVGALVNVWAYFPRCIRVGRARVVVTPVAAARAGAVIDAAERSAASGMPQEVEIF